MLSYLNSELLNKTFSSVLYSYLFLYSSINISFANEILPAKYNNTESLSEQIKPLENNRLKKTRNQKEIDDTSSRQIKLKDLDNIIKENSNELNIMEFRIAEARHLLRSEISLWYPTLNLSSAGLPQYMKGNTYNELSTSTSNDQIKSSIEAKLKWDLINPSRIPRIVAARAEFDKARLSYDIKYQDLLLEAKIQFLELKKSLQDIHIAKESFNTSKELFKQARYKLNTGLASKLDFLEAKTQLLNDKQLLVEKRGLKRINQIRLKKLLNLNSNETPIIESSSMLIGLWKLTLEESIPIAYKYNEDLKNLILEKSIVNNRAKISLSEARPTISIFNTFDGYFSKGESYVAKPRKNNSINSSNNTFGIEFDWLVYNGGYAKSKYNANMANLREVDARIALTKTQIRGDIEQYYFRLDIARNNIMHSYRAKKAAKEALRLALLRLESGITNQREVLNNQRDLTQSEAAYVKALNDYNLFLIRLQRETGISELMTCKSLDKGSKNISQSLDICKILKEDYILLN